jgi:exonuclease SbcC
LSQISVSNFRSLQGAVTVALDAPVVLLYGPNGAGKTSVLSALELALTGDVAAMRRADALYRTHLVHRGAEFAHIALSAVDIESRGESSGMTVQEGQIKGPAFLAPELARFFSERCYLAQSTLGRLLEIYQSVELREDSPLTRFVKDLLGLDRLDALIEGLQPVGDVRNLRRLVPEYAQAERARDAAQQRLSITKVSLRTLEAKLKQTETSILEALAFLDGAAVGHALSADVDSRLADAADERELIALDGQRRDLLSLKQRAAMAITPEGTPELADAEHEVQAASAELAAWQGTTGKGLEALIAQLREWLPDLPSVGSTDPSLAHSTALARVDGELTRCNPAIADDDRCVAQIEQLQLAVIQSRARIAIVDEQMGTIVGEAGDLSRAIAALIPYIHGEDCPVCSRNFAEISSQPLAHHVSVQVARLTEQAARLETLGKTRSEASSDLARSERELNAALARRLSSDVRSQLKTRVAALTHLRRMLDDLAQAAHQGGHLMRRDAEARRDLSELRMRDRLGFEVRTGIAQLCTSMAQPPLELSESTSDAMSRLETHITQRRQEITLRQTRRRQARDELRQYRSYQTELTQLRLAFQEDTATKAGEEAAIESAEGIRQSAKALANAAGEARGAIVGRVFNSALNKVWRDLFVRLAPTEPFVPAFRLPGPGIEPISAQLETVHRDGGRGGAPGAMLSSGNLNTAALTLFLALHLSVKAQLPWLILDDPVQSMDEVHIAQFAALLRTLSKELQRQVIIAVHDRPLFDYLSLELSPAFDGDRLITVELGRSTTGSSFAEPTFHNWKPDRAVAAA